MVRHVELVWDNWNEEHIARHGVDPEEAEEVARNAPFMVRVRDGLYRLIGQTDGGRYLAIYVAPAGGRLYYVVTARNATPNERRAYRGR